MTVLGVVQRVEPGNEVADHAVGVDESEDAGMHRGGGRTGRLGLTKLEALEEDAPGLVHGRGIGAPALVLRFDEVKVPAGGEGRACHIERLLPRMLRSSRYSI